MKSLKKLREAMGISQQEMAGLLGLRRSRVAMAEIGKRTLPDDARMFVAWMLDEMDGWPAATEPEMPRTEAIRREIRHLELRLAQRTLALEIREYTDQQAGFRRHICGAFENRFPDRLPLLAKNTIAVLNSVDDLRQDTTQMEAPLFLQAKIKALEQGIAWLKASLPG